MAVAGYQLCSTTIVARLCVLLLLLDSSANYWILIVQECCLSYVVCLFQVENRAFDDIFKMSLL
jgi:hypothetical protein